MKRFLAPLLLLLCLSGTQALAQKGTGLILDEERYERSTLRQATLTNAAYAQLPPSFSLKAWCPYPGNQLQLNTSAGWAAAYGARTILEAQRKGWTDAREIAMQAYSPVYNYTLVKPTEDEDCDSPVHLSDLLESMNKAGSPRYFDLPSFCPQELPEGLEETAIAASNIGFNRLYDAHDNADYKVKALKKALAEGFPIVAGMHCPPSFLRAEEFWRPVELYSTDFPGHAMVVVGYDDSKFGGAFEVLNSWGKGWGNEGYTWILYKDFAEFFPQAFELFETAARGQGDADLSGSLVFELESGQEMIISPHEMGSLFRMVQPWASGTRFRILVSNNEPAYLYAFGSDATEAIFPVFPPRKWVSAYLPYRSNNFEIPGSGNLIQMDNTTGKDYFCFVYSLEKIDFEALVAALEAGQGTFVERVEAGLGEVLVSPDHINWGDKGIIFTASSHGKSAVAVIIEITHI